MRLSIKSYPNSNPIHAHTNEEHSISFGRILNIYVT